MSRGIKEWNCWFLPYIFGSRGLAGKIIMKIIINTNMRQNSKCKTKSNRIWKVKVKTIEDWK